jgi:PadR family transcriptional regulator PadR
MPLKQKAFHVLLSLDERPLHGYAIRKRVLEVSEGAFELEPGGLYRLLARLERDGLIEQTEPPEDEESADPRRLYYTLTDLGRRALVAEAKRLSGLVERPEVAALTGRG